MIQTPYLHFDGNGNFVGSGNAYTPDTPAATEANSNPTPYAPFFPAGTVQCTLEQQSAAGLWTTLVDGEIVLGTAPAPTPAEQAAAMIAAGCQIASTSNPALNGTYALGQDQQNNLNSLYNIIANKNSGSFPSGLTELPYPDASGTPHVFTTAAEFIAFEAAISAFVLQLQLIITLNAGTLPTQPVSIP